MTTVNMIFFALSFSILLLERRSYEKLKADKAKAVMRQHHSLFNSQTPTKGN